jgi:hypothetical protein
VLLGVKIELGLCLGLAILLIHDIPSGRLLLLLHLPLLRWGRLFNESHLSIRFFHSTSLLSIGNRRVIHKPRAYLLVEFDAPLHPNGGFVNVLGRGWQLDASGDLRLLLRSHLAGGTRFHLRS